MGGVHALPFWIFIIIMIWTYYFAIFEEVMLHMIDIIIPVFAIFMAIRLVSDLAFRN